MGTGSEVDFLVIGAGVAGLRAAVELASQGNVLVVTKESVGESNTHYAQGGIAVAMEGQQDVALHLEDTVNAGDGIVYRPAAEVLAAEGPGRVAELIEWGARFDQADGKLLRTREGAHSLARILHASGDATGAEISRSLTAFARSLERVRFAEWTRVVELLVADGRITGVELAEACPSGKDCTPWRVSARAVLVASGGAGQVYSDTTNPAVATGDGIALAAQAGAELADMEFYQFHPTALLIPGAPRFLLSEALRGEGAYLRNDRDERFMERYHHLLELAPRDVVARAIAREGMDAEGATRPVYLDMRHVSNLNLHERFPGISAFLARYGLDLARDLVPVRPAAHYLMGGIRTDLAGRTSVGGLYAAGEAACTGVHGANRLASNSLLEGLVFGARAAQAMLADDLPLMRVEIGGLTSTPLSPPEEQQVESTIVQLQSAMWAYAGLLREEEMLRQGFAVQAQCEAEFVELSGQSNASRRLSEGRALSRVAHTILQAALARTESRGAHFRNDYPQRNDREFGRHSVLQRDGRVAFEAW
jgi:L-aspartate oxidase